MESPKIKVIFSCNRNPHFESFTDYFEKALKESGCHTLFFENRDFVIPGRLRDRIKFLNKMDLERLNKRLLKIAKDFKPHLFLEGGGWNILPQTIEAMKDLGIKTALWTNDPPRFFEPIIKAAPHYDFVFTAGSEAIEILKEYKVKELHLLPFACEPDFHKPVELGLEDKKKYTTDICFVGSNEERFYPKRRAFLESLAELKVNLGIWGPGWETLSSDSSLKKYVRGGSVWPSEWIKIYSASRMALCIHYQDVEGKIPCYQANPRVFEVLACGSLLMVDNQKDILDLFDPGQDLVIIKNERELKEAVHYYLAHPQEAGAIAERGRRKVLEQHTYRHRVNKVLSLYSEFF